jgi:hypothetical protein
MLIVLWHPLVYINMWLGSEIIPYQKHKMSSESMLNLSSYFKHLFLFQAQFILLLCLPLFITGLTLFPTIFTGGWWQDLSTTVEKYMHIHCFATAMQRPTSHEEPIATTQADLALFVLYVNLHSIQCLTVFSQMTQTMRSKCWMSSIHRQQTSTYISNGIFSYSSMVW